MFIPRRTLLAGFAGAAAPASRFSIRRDYLVEPNSIPAFWITSLDDVGRFLSERIRKGTVQVIGTSAGGRRMQMVCYGRPRRGKGTTTFSGSLGFRDVRAYLGPEHQRKVYLAMASVHGGEFEGIVGAVNLLSVLESGRDLRGRQWPRITAAAAALDRILVIPITNPDGRARVPLRMMPFVGSDHTVHEYFNTGAKPDGNIIGWPQCKEFIPLDFSTTQFPGGYPNDAGVNIQHDDFFGAPQPETRALFELTARERPDLILNMHTGGDALDLLPPFGEPILRPIFDQCYRHVVTAIRAAGLRGSDDAAAEVDPSRLPTSAFNLDSALNLHCGTLAITVECPAHNFSRLERNGQPFAHLPDHLLDAQLTCHQEAMTFLAETGGRVRWTQKQRRGE